MTSGPLRGPGSSLAEAPRRFPRPGTSRSPARSPTSTSTPGLPSGGPGAHEPAGWLSRIGRISLDTAGARVLGHRVALGTPRSHPGRRTGPSSISRSTEKGWPVSSGFPVDPASGEGPHSPRAAVSRRSGFRRGEDAAGESPEEEPPGEGRPRSPLGPPGRNGGPRSTHASSRFASRSSTSARSARSGTATEHGIRVEELSTRSSDLPGKRPRKLARRQGRDSPPAGSKPPYGRETSRGSSPPAGLDEEAAAGGRIEIGFDLAWPGAPFEPSLEKNRGHDRDARQGRAPAARARGARSVACSLSSAWRPCPGSSRVDLSHVFGKGLAYDPNHRADANRGRLGEPPRVHHRRARARASR